MINEFYVYLTRKGLRLERNRDVPSNKLTYILNDQMVKFKAQASDNSFAEFIYSNAVLMNKNDMVRVSDFFSRMYNTLSNLYESVFEVRTFLFIIIEEKKIRGLAEDYLVLREGLLKLIGSSCEIKTQTSNIVVSPIYFIKLLEILNTPSTEFKGFLTINKLSTQLKYVTVDVLVQFYLSDQTRLKRILPLISNLNFKEFKNKTLLSRVKAKIMTVALLIRAFRRRKGMKEASNLDEAIKNLKKTIREKTYFREDTLKLFISTFIEYKRSQQIGELHYVKEGFELKLAEEKKAYFVLLAKKLNRKDIGIKEMAHHTIQLLYLKQLADIKKLIKETEEIKNSKRFEEVIKLGLTKKDLLLYEFFRRETIESLKKITNEPWQEIVKQRFIKIEDFDKDIITFVKRAETNLNREIDMRIDMRNEKIDQSINFIRYMHILDDIVDFLQVNLERINPSTKLTEIINSVLPRHVNNLSKASNSKIYNKSKILNKPNVDLSVLDKKGTIMCAKCKDLIDDANKIGKNTDIFQGDEIEESDEKFLKNDANAGASIMNYVQKKKNKGSYLQTIVANNELNKIEVQNSNGNSFVGTNNLLDLGEININAHRNSYPQNLNLIDDIVFPPPITLNQQLTPKRNEALLPPPPLCRTLVSLNPTRDNSQSKGLATSTNITNTNGLSPTDFLASPNLNVLNNNQDNIHSQKTRETLPPPPLQMNYKRLSPTSQNNKEILPPPIFNYVAKLPPPPISINKNILPSPPITLTNKYLLPPPSITLKNNVLPPPPVPINNNALPPPPIGVKNNILPPPPINMKNKELPPSLVGINEINLTHVSRNPSQIKLHPPPLVFHKINEQPFFYANNSSNTMTTIKENNITLPPPPLPVNKTKLPPPPLKLNLINKTDDPPQSLIDKRNMLPPTLVELKKTKQPHESSFALAVNFESNPVAVNKTVLLPPRSSFDQSYKLDTPLHIRKRINPLEPNIPIILETDFNSQHFMKMNSQGIEKPPSPKNPMQNFKDSSDLKYPIQMFQSKKFQRIDNREQDKVDLNAGNGAITVKSVILTVTQTQPSYPVLTRSDGRKMKTLFWEKIENQQIPFTLWPTILSNDTNIQLTNILEYFEDKKVEKVAFTVRTNKNTKIDLIGDDTRSNILSIAVTKLLKINKLTWPEILTMIMDINTEKVGYETLLSLKRLAPTAIELEKAKNFKEDLDSLDVASRWICEIRIIPRFNQRFDALALMHEFDNNYSGLKNYIETFFETCEMLKENTVFHKFMRVCLDAGNFLNTNTRRGDAYGFKALSLKEFITCTSTVKSGVSLMEYLLIEINRSSPGLLEFVGFLKMNCEVSASRNLEDAIDDINELKGKFNILRGHLEAAERAEPPDIGFIKKFENFLAENGEKIIILEEEGLRTKEFYFEVMILLGETERKLKMKKSKEQMGAFSAIFTKMHSLLAKINKADLKF